MLIIALKVIIRVLTHAWLRSWEHASSAFIIPTMIIIHASAEHCLIKSIDIAQDTKRHVSLDVQVLDSLDRSFCSSATSAPYSLVLIQILFKQSHMWVWWAELVRDADNSEMNRHHSWTICSLSRQLDRSWCPMQNAVNQAWNWQIPSTSLRPSSTGSRIIAGSNKRVNNHVPCCLYVPVASISLADTLSILHDVFGPKTDTAASCSLQKLYYYQPIDRQVTIYISIFTSNSM